MSTGIREWRKMWISAALVKNLKRVGSLFILVVFVWLIERYWPVEVKISNFGNLNFEPTSLKMPLKDKRRLDYFFREVCFRNAWAYTLLGSKPMSIHQYTKPSAALRQMIFNPEVLDVLVQCFWPPDIRGIFHLLNLEQIRIRNGWEALNKYVKKLSVSRFFLYTNISKDNKTVVLGLVDKVKLIDIVFRYREDFQGLLEASQVEPKDLLDDTKLSMFLKAICDDQLIGTVLGFGRDNASLFNKYRMMKVSPKNRPMIGVWQELENEHLEKIAQKNRTMESWHVVDLFYPTFVCDPDSEETKQLKQSYRKEREEIIKYYEGKDVVEATLSLLSQPLPSRRVR